MLPGVLIHENFFPEAEALRAGFDAHFANPYQHSAETHQVWNYWFVPGQYTYLRTQPEKVLPRDVLERFFAQLKRLAFEKYGLSFVTWPYLSLYVAGCQQGLHNDSKNGRLGYVYSLTRWSERKFYGGETLVFREKDYFSSDAILQPGADTAFYDLVPSRFNQLLLFDDRLIHGVPRLEGSMRPEEGRIVLHGHLAEGPPVIVGPLNAAAAQAVFAARAAEVQHIIQSSAAGLAGLVTLRLTIDEDGRVAGTQELFSRLMPTRRDSANPDGLVAALLDLMPKLRFPAAPHPSVITLPIPFGAALNMT